MQTPMLLELERRSLPDQIVTSLRQSIVSGKLAPGTRLREADLADQLAVSRAAVREALRTLEAEGLTVSYPNRGAVVVEFTVDDYVEICTVRLLIEPQMVGLATTWATDDEIEELQSLATAMNEAAQRGDHTQMEDLDLRFHRRIWEIARQPRLLRLLMEMESQIRAFMAASSKIGERLRGSVFYHENIMDAIRARQSDRAAESMRQHLQAILEAMRQIGQQPH